MANKLKGAVQASAHEHEMLIEGLIGIAQGDNPRVIESRLRGYLH
jgi:chemotaxis protein MotA